MELFHIYLSLCIQVKKLPRICNATSPYIDSVSQYNVGSYVTLWVFSIFRFSYFYPTAIPISMYGCVIDLTVLMNQSERNYSVLPGKVMTSYQNIS